MHKVAHVAGEVEVAQVAGLSSKGSKPRIS